MSSMGDGGIVRLVRTAEGVEALDKVVDNLCICLQYLEARARDAGMAETADLIGVAALSAEEQREG